MPSSLVVLFMSLISFFVFTLLGLWVGECVGKWNHLCWRMLGPLAAEGLSWFASSAGSRLAAANEGGCVSLFLLLLLEFYPLFMFVFENMQIWLCVNWSDYKVCVPRTERKGSSQGEQFIERSGRFASHAQLTWPLTSSSRRHERGSGAQFFLPAAGGRVLEEESHGVQTKVRRGIQSGNR